MKTLFLLVFSLFFGCGGGSSSPTINSPPVQPVTIKGDSMAAGCNEFGCGNTWWLLLTKDSENDGVSGAPIDYFLSNPDNRTLKTVILFMGFNNVKHQDQSVSYIVGLYALVIQQTQAQRIICVGIPPMNHALSDIWYPDGAWIPADRIEDVNEGIKGICPNFIKTSDVDTVDGIHPTYDKIIARLNKKLQE